MKIRAGTSPTLSGFLALTALALPFPLAAQSSRTPAQDKDAEEQARVDRQYRFEESLARQYGTRDLRDLLKRAAETRVREIERDRELRKYRRDRGLSPQAGPTWSTLGPTSRIHRLSSVTSDDNGLVASIAINPNDRNNIFIGSAGGGVWRTRDGGTTWSLVTGNVGILQIGAVALAPSQPTRVYAGTGCADASSFRLGNARSTGYPLKLGVGVLISNDGGDTWRVSRTSPADYFWQILVDPTNPDILLVAGDRGVQRSTDGGDTWSAVLAGETTPWATRLTRPNSPATTIFAATWGPGVAGSVYKSTDSGVTWAVKANGLPGDDSTRTRVEVAVAPADANRVYALIDGGGTQLDFARSTDGGETWAGLNVNSKVPTNAPDATVNILTKQGDFCNVLAVDPSNPAVVHAGGTDMWKTTDGGETWLWATDWKGTERNYVHADIHTVVFGPDGTLYNGNDGGLFSSADGGLSYRALNRGTLSFLVSGLCFDENNPDRIAIGAQDNGNSLRVSGTDWRETTTGDGFGCVFHPTSSDFLFVSTQNQNILRTSDGGQTFRRRVEGLTKALTKDAVFGTLVVGSPGSGAFR